MIIFDKDVTHFNDKRQRHGYWEEYWMDGHVARKGNYSNGHRIGYWEFLIDCEIIYKKYFIL